jgi:hypothetical protein
MLALPGLVSGLLQSAMVRVAIVAVANAGPFDSAPKALRSG